MSNNNLIKIKHILTLTYKNLSSSLLENISFDSSCFTSENGLIINLETLENYDKDSFSFENAEELSKIIKLMNDNNCEFLMIREG